MRCVCLALALALLVSPRLASSLTGRTALPFSPCLQRESAKSKGGL
jgi:hypothetical protein